jgi:FHS family L-fucose permease-like MFS transporter
MRAAVVGLLTMTAGCLLFEPASAHGMFGLFLVALFVLASGITTVQVVANPLISRLGSASTASSRLTFAQAFNSLGTTIFPYVGSILILGSFAAADSAALRTDETHIVVLTYRGLAAALVILAAVVWLRRNALDEKPAEHASIFRSFDLLARPRFRFGALCIFLYVGAEVAIGSVIVSYLMQDNVLGIGAEQAGKHVPFYWGMAMLGRFLGAYVLRLMRPGKVLAAAAGSAILLLLLSAASAGPVAAWSLLAIGLFNSIMFPTIFTLASEGLGKRTAEGSGIICVAIVGGAVVPILTGRVADLSSLRWALLVPAACYSVIVLFGWFTRRPLEASLPAAEPMGAS